VTRDRATLATIAERVGVSRSTVSNAYNRPDQLSAELRQRILAAAAEVGYAGPDPAARLLRRGRVGAIGLVQHSLRYTVGDAANRMLLDGVAEVCEQEGLALVLIDRRPPRPDRPDVLRNALVDGVIIHCDALDADRLRLIADRQLPTVVLDSEAIGDGLSVGIDDEGGARAAAQHIVDLGHRRVAILTLDSRGADAPHLITGARQRGYLGPLDEAGCETTVEPAGGLEWPEFAAMVRELLRRDPPPTAILAMSDDIAAGVVRVADEIGVAIPQQLSVVGFDDTPVASGLVPPLTTIRQDHATKGRLAARMLLGQVEAKRVRLPVKLVIRASTAPPADAPAHPHAG
jgi:DNA-binding LacI/PurR family transcriptional regulator